MLLRILLGLICLALVSGCSAYSVSEKNMLSQQRLADWNNRHDGNNILRVKYEPAFPTPVSVEHVFFEQISLGKIEGVPEVIRNVNIAIASSENFTEALTDALAQSNLLHPEGSGGEYRLDIRYVDSFFRPLSWSNFLSFDSISTTKIHYYLKKVSDHSSVFDREINSVVSLRNGQGWEREQKAEQFSHMSNIASLVWCLEQYDGKEFPQKCSLELITELIKK